MAYGTGYSGSTLGTSSQTSSYLIPGAQAAYQGAAGNLSGQYANLGSQLGQGYGGLYNAAMGQTGLFGATEQQQINNLYDQQRAQQRQSNISRGLGNTTVQNATDQGLTQSRALADVNLAQNVNSQRLGVMGQFGLPMWQSQQAVGQQGLAGQQSLAQQYMNMVAQQGVYSTTGRNTGQSANPYYGQMGGAGGGARGGSPYGPGMTTGTGNAGGPTVQQGLSPYSYLGNSLPNYYSGGVIASPQSSAGSGYNMAALYGAGAAGGMSPYASDGLAGMYGGGQSYQDYGGDVAMGGDF